MTPQEQQAPKGYWLICTRSYEIDGHDISRGTMKYYTSLHPIVSSNWRRATENEIETKKHNPKGTFYKWYNHNL